MDLTCVYVITNTNKHYIKFFNLKKHKKLQRKFKAYFQVNSKLKVYQVYGVTLCFVSHGVKLLKSIVDNKSDSVINWAQFFCVFSQFSMFRGINLKTL